MYRFWQINKLLPKVCCRQVGRDKTADESLEGEAFECFEKFNTLRSVVILYKDNRRAFLGDLCSILIHEEKSLFSFSFSFSIGLFLQTKWKKTIDKWKHMYMCIRFLFTDYNLWFSKLNTIELYWAIKDVRNCFCAEFTDIMTK